MCLKIGPVRDHIFDAEFNEVAIKKHYWENKIMNTKRSRLLAQLFNQSIAGAFIPFHVRVEFGIARDIHLQTAIPDHSKKFVTLARPIGTFIEGVGHIVTIQ